MAKLYFLDREFEGISMVLDEALERGDTAEIKLLFFDSWYWLHYRFFNCRDGFACETSSVVRTHLFNLVAALYQQFEALPSKLRLAEDEIQTMINELVDIAESAKTFPISYWTYGDELSRTRLRERFSGLPSAAQIERLLELPCFNRMQYERLPYCFDSEEAAFARYQQEKLVFINRQSKRSKLDHPHGG